MTYVWYNAELNEIAEFSKLAHLLLRVYEVNGKIIFLGTLK